MPHPRPEIGAPLSTRFWGVRGSVPTMDPDRRRFGGNTPCVEVKGAGHELLIFDAGTGIRALGRNIAMRPQQPSAIHIFFTHFHWDHIQGIPYFAPLFAAHTRMIFHSVHAPKRLQEILSRLMQAPYFPISFEQLQGSMEFRQIPAQGEEVDGVSVSCFPLYHPQGAVGYRIAHQGRSIVYATDHEHGDSAIDHGLRVVAADADVLIYDAQYTVSEFEERRGWGHSTWLEATNVARDASVKKLVLFHHDPDRNDESVAAMEEDARLKFHGACAAYEGLCL
jgi:phosphoribosyl 1,2-cyclic phosphodiesterase